VVEEEVVEEVIDKLRPRIKSYATTGRSLHREEREDLQRGLYKEGLERLSAIRQAEEEKTMGDIMRKWAGTKTRLIIEQRRRAESARMMTKNIGTQFERYSKKLEINFRGSKVIHFTQAPMTITKSNTRALPAFRAQSSRAHNEGMQAAILTGRLNDHVSIVQEESTQLLMKPTNDRVCSFADKPKKKTFEEILKEAEQRANIDTHEEIEGIKEALIFNKVSLGGNKIYKSLSQYEP
jgi:hypothetical protein